MKKNKVKPKVVEYQLCSVPDSEGLTLELSIDDEPAFMEIRVDDENKQWIRIFPREAELKIPLEDLRVALDIAKREVVNVYFDDLDD